MVPVRRNRALSDGNVAFRVRPVAAFVDISEDMICWPVSARVGNVNNNDPSLSELINIPSH